MPRRSDLTGRVVRYWNAMPQPTTANQRAAARMRTHGRHGPRRSRRGPCRQAGRMPGRASAADRRTARRHLCRPYAGRRTRGCERSAVASARLVTLDGELVDEHGGVAFGPRQSATSLVSRRSQLRAARLDLAVLDQQIADAHRETQHLKREIERHEQALQQLADRGQAARPAARATSRQPRNTLAERLAANGSAETDRVQDALAAAGERCAGDRSGPASRRASDLSQAQAAAEQIQAPIAGQDEAAEPARSPAASGGRAK